MTSSLPLGWTVALIDEVSYEVRSGFASGNKNAYGGVSHLRMNNIGVRGELVLDTVRAVPPNLAKPNYFLEPGDVIVCTTNSTKLVGKCAFFDLVGRYAFSNHLTRLRPLSRLVDGKFLRWNLWVLWRSGAFEEKCKHWVNQSTLPKEELLNTPVLVPPLPEQRRIVAKLEKLLDKVDSCQKRLAKIPVLLKRFRQAVLTAACSGRLTEDWREENGAAGSSTVRDASGSLLDESDFPNGWHITNLGALAKLVTSGSRGWAKYYAESGAIFIRAQNINSDILDLEEPAYVQLPQSCEGVRTKVQLQDILVTITGANVTKSALVQTHIEDAYVSQHVALLRLKDVRVSEFVFLSLLSPMHGRRQLRSLAYGQGKPGLNLDNIRSVVLALPPLVEQNEIVRRVKQLFALADQIEARYEKAKEYVDNLKQSILAKAFRGELVPQDPNDEPATALLERISGNSRDPASESPRRRANNSGSSQKQLHFP